MAFGLYSTQRRPYLATPTDMAELDTPVYGLERRIGEFSEGLSG